MTIANSGSYLTKRGLARNVPVGTHSKDKRLEIENIQFDAQTYLYNPALTWINAVVYV